MEDCRIMPLVMRDNMYLYQLSTGKGKDRRRGTATICPVAAVNKCCERSVWGALVARVLCRAEGELPGSNGARL